MMRAFRTWLFFRLLAWASPFPFVSLYAPGAVEGRHVLGVVLAMNKGILNRILGGWTLEEDEG